jgi:hypothetical protein
MNGLKSKILGLSGSMSLLGQTEHTGHSGTNVQLRLGGKRHQIVVWQLLELLHSTRHDPAHTHLVAFPTPLAMMCWVWKAASKAQPREKQDWILRCLPSGRAHPLAGLWCGDGLLRSTTAGNTQRFG